MKNLKENKMAKINNLAFKATGAAMLANMALTFCTGTNTAMAGLLAMFCTVVMYIGIILVCYGFYQFAMSMQSNNPDERIKAVTTMVVAIILIGMKPLLNTLLSSIGAGIQIP